MSATLAEVSKVGAFLRRDWLIMLSYRAALVGDLVHLVIEWQLGRVRADAVDGGDAARRRPLTHDAQLGPALRGRDQQVGRVFGARQREAIGTAESRAASGMTERSYRAHPRSTAETEACP